MDNRVIQIFCDGNSSIGYGHVRRSISLAKFVQSKGYRVQLRGLSEAVNCFISDFQNDEGEAKIAVLDSPNDITSKIKMLMSQGIKTIGLDTRCEFPPHLTISVFEHQRPLPSGRRVSGLEYVIIRNDLLNGGVSKMSIEGKRVLIVLGGGDLKGNSLDLSKKLASWGYEVDVVLGPLVDIKDAHNQVENIKIHRSPDNFIELMKGCDWAVSNGGGCLFELLYLGKPVFIVPQTDAEERIGSLFRECVLGIGLDNLRRVTDDEIVSSAKNCTKLIDGRGSERILNHIEELLNE